MGRPWPAAVTGRGRLRLGLRWTRAPSARGLARKPYYGPPSPPQRFVEGGGERPPVTSRGSRLRPVAGLRRAPRAQTILWSAVAGWAWPERSAAAPEAGLRWPWPAVTGRGRPSPGLARKPNYGLSQPAAPSARGRRSRPTRPWDFGGEHPPSLLKPASAAVTGLRLTHGEGGRDSPWPADAHVARRRRANP